MLLDAESDKNERKINQSLKAENCLKSVNDEIPVTLQIIESIGNVDYNEEEMTFQQLESNTSTVNANLYSEPSDCSSGL